MLSGYYVICEQCKQPNVLLRNTNESKIIHHVYGYDGEVEFFELEWCCLDCSHVNKDRIDIKSDI